MKQYITEKRTSELLEEVFNLCLSNASTLDASFSMTAIEIHALICSGIKEWINSQSGELPAHIWPESLKEEIDAYTRKAIAAAKGKMGELVAEKILRTALENLANAFHEGRASPIDVVSTGYVNSLVSAAENALMETAIFTHPSQQAAQPKYLIEAEWPDRFGVPLEVLSIHDLGGGKVGIRVKPHESREQALQSESVVNEWKEAVLDHLAIHCIDAPVDMPPFEIIKKILAVNADIALLHKDEAQPAPQALRWSTSPIKTTWGAGMMVADIGLDKDSTVALYCHQDDIGKVGALFKQVSDPAPQAQPVKQEPLTDEKIADICMADLELIRAFTYQRIAPPGATESGIQVAVDRAAIKLARAIEAFHGIKGEAS